MIFSPHPTTTLDNSIWYMGATTPWMSTISGVLVTNVTTNAYGTYVSVSNGALANNVYGLAICASNHQSAGTNRQSAIKIGVDLAGGTSYSDFITDLLCGSAGQNVFQGGVWYYFPMFIPAGASIGVASRGNQALSFRIIVKPVTKPANVGRLASTFEALGVTLGAAIATGVSITPTASSSSTKSAWTLIGTTTKNNWWWQIGVHVDSASTTYQDGTYQIDLAAGDATNKDIIVQDRYVFIDATTESINIPLALYDGYWNVPSGTNIYGRIQSSAATPSVLRLAVYGCGG